MRILVNERISLKVMTFFKYYFFIINNGIEKQNFF